MPNNFQPIIKTLTYTLLALLAFAGNSLLCRMALASGDIDATSFTSTRLLSGSVILYLLVAFNRTTKTSSFNMKRVLSQWHSSLMLFIYAAGFSFSYMLLDTGTGALILFASVQITIVLSSIFYGERPGISVWCGLFIAFSGFVYLVTPNTGSFQHSISLVGILLMVAAGVAWGLYTLSGKHSSNPLQDTAINFVGTLPWLCFLLFAFTIQPAQMTIKGVVLSISAGAITSGLGYVIWYRALQGLTRIQAAIIQLLVPVVAAFGGAVLLDEPITLQLILALLIILSGIFIATCLPILKNHTSPTLK